MHKIYDIKKALSWFVSKDLLFIALNVADVQMQVVYMNFAREGASPNTL